MPPDPRDSAPGAREERPEPPLHARVFEPVRSALRESLPDFGRKDGGGVLVGFSGGLDSTALLHLAVECARRARKARGVDRPARSPVVAAHLDHALHPDSARLAREAERIAAALGVPFVSARREVEQRARREHRPVEEAGRLERLDFFAEAARDRGLSAVALGHTRTDQAETLLLRLSRGAGGLGLGAMPRVRRDDRGFRILRPLLEVSRAEIAALGRQEGWTWIEDPSNAGLDFARNRIRQQVVPLLKEALNPQIEAALGRAAELLREDEASLDRLAARRLTETATVLAAGGRTEVRIPAAALQGVDPALERRLIREGLRRVRGHLRRIGFVHIEAVLEAARRRRGGASLDLPGARVRLERGLLAITAAGEVGAPVEPEPAGSVPPSGWD